jgi:hypothetical protein
LYKLIALIHAEQWVMMGVKDKGDIYEGEKCRRYQERRGSVLYTKSIDKSNGGLFAS